MTKITKEAIEALKPFADAVFNDNGDITVDLAFAKSEDFIKAYFAHKRLSTLPIAGEGKVKALSGPRINVCWTQDNSPNPRNVVLISEEDFNRANAALSSPGKDGGQEVGSTHEERIALAAALTWDVSNITPDDVRGIIERLASEGFRIQRIGGQENAQ